MVIETPIIIVPRYELGGIESGALSTGLPQLSRTESLQISEAVDDLNIDIQAHILQTRASNNADKRSDTSFSSRYEIIYPYIAKHDDELSVAIGAIVQKLVVFADEYCEVKIVGARPIDVHLSSGFVALEVVDQDHPPSTSALLPPEYESSGVVDQIFVSEVVENRDNVLPSYFSNPAINVSDKKSMPVISPPAEASTSESRSYVPEEKVAPPDSHIQPVVVDRCVSTESILAHLGLLHRFQALTQHIMAGRMYVKAALCRASTTPDEEPNLLDWTFFCRAELRYMKWLEFLKQRHNGKWNEGGNVEVILPPLDVAMIWQAHMLNPLRYYEDMYRVFGIEQAHFEYPLLEMHALPGLDYDPPEHHQQLWASHTNYLEPFTLSVHDITTPIISPCPLCKRESDHEPSAYAAFCMRQGILQCSHHRCGNSFSCDTISVKHMLDDITEFVESRSHSGFLKGSLLNQQTCKIEIEGARRHLDQMYRADVPHGNVGSLEVYNIVRRIILYGRSDSPNWDGLSNLFSRLKPALVFAHRSTPNTLPRRMVQAYRNIPFKSLSLDLIAAVACQRGFTSKMVSGVVDWSNPNTVACATVRYHKFLILMSKEKYLLFVPTLDLDLAWHQLHPVRYQNYGIQNVGCIINHDDSIDEVSLSDGFEATKETWKSVFGEVYAQIAPEAEGPVQRLPAYAIYAATKSVADKQKGKQIAHAVKGGCSFHAGNRELKNLHVGGELGHYSNGAKCAACGTYVLLACGGLAQDWGVRSKEKTVGGEDVGACAGSTVGSLSVCGTQNLTNPRPKEPFQRKF
ncbi:hypothetical protein BJ742DRAFT_888454 [Cladochytrium replicatum]|nr:hypothetical protein BJ742DRAFT_888454 [Cladochytrium replicatum]